MTGEIHWDGDPESPDRAGVIVVGQDEIASISREAGTNAGVYRVHDLMGGDVYIGNSEAAAIAAAIKRAREIDGL